MSHFSVIVLLPQDTPRDRASIEDAVAATMRPYQENNMGDCPREFLKWNDQEEGMLIEWRTGSHEMVVAEDGDLVYRWDDRFRVPGSFGIGTNTHQVPDTLERRQVPFLETYPTFEAFAADYHGRESRDPETGRYGYWENPNAKWDWWQVGGRWTGAFVAGYDPETDPRNIKPCDICGGSGLRDDYLGQQARAEDPSYTCNGCRGKGSRPEWPTRWADFCDDAMTVSDVPADLWKAFAFVLPDGRWVERGNMGWFATVTDEKDEGAWEEVCHGLQIQHADCVAVMVDCHI